MALTFDQVKSLVSANNHSNFSDALVIAICWKESSFDPSAQASGSSARGLMQITKAAREQSNKVANTTFSDDDMFEAWKNIQCGSAYLQWCFKVAGGADERSALQKYHGDNTVDYASDLMTAETCLKGSPQDPMTCLTPIHGLEV